MTNNFLSARKLRRRIIKHLTDQQRLDSTCSETLRITISSHTRKILEMISRLLMGFTSGNMSPDDRLAFSSIAPPSLTAENWFKLREEEASSAAEVARLCSLLGNAKVEYDRLAPWGYLNDLFAKKEDELKIEGARSRRSLLRTQRESEESAHRRKVEAIQSSATLFLRNAMSAEGLRSLLTSSSISNGLQDALNLMNNEVTAVWTSHARSQTDLLEKVRVAIAELFEIYDRKDLNDSTPLLGGRRASAGD
jgi:hypothetical protein